jgi:serine/threonine protein kinase
LKNRRCPRCHSHYAAPARFCPSDGTPLVEVSPTADEGAGGRDGAGAVARDPGGGGSAVGLTGQMVDGRYRVSRRLGEGGMAYVYLAEDLESGAPVAVKILTPRLSRDPASVERLRREAAIAMRLDHPNVCRILRVGETADKLMYLVMPYLPGEPLSEAENRRGPYPVAEGIAILVQMCRGLQHAHALQIVHRDLKPENIMLIPDEASPFGRRAVVMDFGLAKERRADPEVVKLTQTGIVLGTPEFMSPEQIRGKPLDGRSDIYAVGVLAFEMFTGRLPFEGRNPQEAMLARLKAQPLRLRAVREDLPPRLETVITKALAVLPDERYPSMMDMAAAFESVGGTGMFARLFGR